jgi:hypothetical protein
VLCAAVVRARPELESERIGVVEVGDLLVVVRREGGRLERRDGGWVSERAGDGTVLLERSKAKAALRISSGAEGLERRIAAAGDRAAAGARRGAERFVAAREAADVELPPAVAAAAVGAKQATGVGLEATQRLLSGVVGGIKQVAPFLSQF